MFQLQLYNSTTRRYAPKATGDDPAFLMKFGSTYDCPRRVVSRQRELGRDGWYMKPLPLKPRKVVPAPRRYRLGAAIETPSEDVMLTRAIEHYRKLSEANSGPVIVRYWIGSTFGERLCGRMRGARRLQLIALDPDEPGCAFGPDNCERLNIQRAA